MKLLSLTLAAAAMAVTVAASAASNDDRGPGLTAQRQGDALVYPAHDFSAIGLGGAAKVEVRVGGNYSVRAVGPAAAFDNFRIVTHDDTLEIGSRYRTHRPHDDLQKRITVYVTLPRLVAANIGGSGALRADTVAGKSFSGAVGGSGQLRIDSLKVDRAEASIGGSGDISAAGSVSVLTVNIGGSGSFSGPALHAASAKVSSAGSGKIRAQVDGPAKVSLVGSGDVDLGGTARCSVTKMGSGSVRCGA